MGIVPQAPLLGDLGCISCSLYFKELSGQSALSYPNYKIRARLEERPVLLLSLPAKRLRREFAPICHPFTFRGTRYGVA